MHSPSFSLDALFQSGLEAPCVKGSLTKVTYIISPSQTSTANTAIATDTLNNQAPMGTLWLTQKVDRLNYPEDTEDSFFP